MRFLKFARSTPGILLTLICSLFFFTTAIVHAVDNEKLHQIGLDEDKTADGTGDYRANILGLNSGHFLPTSPGVPDWEDLFDSSGMLADRIAPAGPDVLDFPGGVTASFVRDDVSAGSAVDNTTFVSKGSDKNSDQISTLRWGPDSVPAKNDIGNSYVHAKLNAGQLIIYAGVERIVEDGANHVDFEFNQSSIGADQDGDGIADPINPATGPVCEDGADCFLVGERTDGDILLSMDFEKGGNFGNLTIREWIGDDATGSWSAPLADLEGEGCNDTPINGFPIDVMCGFNNDTTIKGGPWDNYDRSGVIVDDLPPNAFTEVGFNVTELLEGAVPCFSTVQVKTRSSPSFSAELKDFQLADFNVCGISVSKSCSADIASSGDKVKVLFDGVITNTGALDFISTIEDNIAGSIITAVCIDDYPAAVNGTPAGDGDCTAEDTKPTYLANLNTARAEFNIEAGQKLLYLGEYEENGPFSLPLSFSDTVTAIAYQDVADIGNADKEIDSDTASFTCSPTVAPKVVVEKSCSAVLNTDGDAVSVTISGTVKNDGNTLLKDVTVTDDRGTSATGDDVVVFGPADLAPGSGPQNFTKNLTFNIDQVTHADVVTATANDALTGQAITPDTDDADCKAAAEAAIEVDKNCSLVLVEGDSVELTVSGTISNKGTVKLTNLKLVDDFGTTETSDDKVITLSRNYLAPMGHSSGDDTLAYSATYKSADGDFDVTDLTFNSSTGKYEHSDTVNASAKSAIKLDHDNDYVSGQGAPATADKIVDVNDDSDLAKCDVLINPDVKIEKSCEASLMVMDGKLVVAVDVEATITNTGNEDLTNLSVVDDPAVSFKLKGGGDVPTSMEAGGSPITIVGRYFPATLDTSDPTNFSDMIDVTAKGAFTTVTASDMEDATCGLCPTEPPQ